VSEEICTPPCRCWERRLPELEAGGSRAFSASPALCVEVGEGKDPRQMPEWWRSRVSVTFLTDKVNDSPDGGVGRVIASGVMSYVMVE